MEVDEALESLGKYGLWQLWHYGLFATAMMVPACFQVLGIIFIGAVPPHHCRVEDNSSLIYVEKEGELVIDGCHMLDYNATINTTVGQNATTVACKDGWVYDEKFGNTIVSQWDLVCGDNYLSELSQTLFGIGMLMGTLIIPPLTDRFGRKPALLLCHLTLAIVTFIGAFSPNYSAFAVFRVLQGFISTGTLSAGMIIACELFPAKRRTFAGVGIEFFWAFAMFFLCFLGYMIREWRHLRIALALIPALSLSGFWLCPESIPWLVASNRVRQAEKILQKAAKMNKLKLSPVILKAAKKEKITDQSDDEKSRDEKWDCKQWCDCKECLSEYLTLFTNRKLRRNTIILFSLWFVDTLVYFGLQYTSVILTPNRFLNFSLNALVEVPAAILSYYFLKRVGRRLPLCGFHFLAGLFLIVLLFVPRKTPSGDSLVWLIVTLNMLGKLFITASFDTILLFTPELFPTNLRNTGFGISAFARVGGMIAPFSTLVARHISWLPGVVFGALSFGVGLLSLCLPETRQRALPQTAEELDQWDEEDCFSCCRKRKKRGRGGDAESGAVEEPVIDEPTRKKFPTPSQDDVML